MGELVIAKDKTLVIVACVLLLAVAVFLIMQPSVPAEEDEVIKVAYLPVVQSLPLFVAVEEGMFEKEGLKVELVRIESPNQIIDALVSGNVDAGAPSVAAGITGIVETRNPGSLKIYSLTCGTFDQLTDELLVAKNSNISSIGDLRGKRLGHIPGIQFSTMAKKILIENGVDPSEVTLMELPVPNQLPALASGGVDAVLTLEPTGTIGTQKNISRFLVASPMVRYVANPWCGGAGVISAKFMRERPEQAEAFVRVMRQAIIETEGNSSAKIYLVKYLDMPESVAEEVPLSLMVNSHDADPGIILAYQQFVDVFYEMNVTDRRVDIEEFLLG